MARLQSKENTQEEIERGKAFGLWLRHGMAAKGWRPKDLHIASGVSESYIGRLANFDGINRTTGAYLRPGEDIIDRLAAALDLDRNEGRRLQGYTNGPVVESPKVFKYDLGEIAGATTFFGSLKELTDDEINKVRRAIQLVLGD